MRSDLKQPPLECCLRRAVGRSNTVRQVQTYNARTVSRKLYCYVDESGQDTQGEFFIVSVVVAGENRDNLLADLERIEQETGKGKTKWTKASYPRRLAYLRRVFQIHALSGKLSYAIYHDSRNYFDLTVRTLQMTMQDSAIVGTEIRATIIIDGMPREQTREVGRRLLRAGLRVKKVRGVSDETDALIRLADALCGFARMAFEGQPDMRALCDKEMRAGFIRQHPVE